MRLQAIAPTVGIWEQLLKSGWMFSAVGLGFLSCGFVHFDKIVAAHDLSIFVEQSRLRGRLTNQALIYSFESELRLVFFEAIPPWLMLRYQSLNTNSCLFLDLRKSSENN